MCRRPAEQDRPGRCRPGHRATARHPPAPGRRAAGGLDAASIASGPVFRPVALGRPTRRETRLTADSTARVIKRAAKAAGLDVAAFSGTACAPATVEADAPLLKVTEVTRHKSLEMLRIYARRVDLFRDHSGAAFL